MPTPIDQLQTERTLLRRWRDSDREPYAAMNADAEVMAIGKAEPGDKTLIDALAPAVTEGKSLLEKDKSFSDVMYGIYIESINGLEKTKEMVWKKGRSRYAGERGLGHPDAGAASITFILKAFANHSKGEVHA